MRASGQHNRRLRRTGSGAPGSQVLDVTGDRREQAEVDKTATHTMPSGMGGTFRVEVLGRRPGEALVRIHMPGTEWHHWYGEIWVKETDLQVL